MKNILLFASGGGSNVKAILDYFKGKDSVKFPVLICNKPQAGVIEIARQYQLDVILIDKTIFQSEVFTDTIDFYKPDLLVLAGFLWKIPDYLIKAFPGKIINIHPALLPKYGGKGMYGHHVHEAVAANKEKESGITIHYVNEKYDEGPPILQKKISIESRDTPEIIATKVLKLEHEWYAPTLEKLLTK